MLRSLMVALCGLGVLLYYGLYCRGRALTPREEIVAFLILLGGMSGPFWL